MKHLVTVNHQSHSEGVSLYKFAESFQHKTQALACIVSILTAEVDLHAYREKWVHKYHIWIHRVMFQCSRGSKSALLDFIRHASRMIRLTLKGVSKARVATRIVPHVQPFDFGCRGGSGHPTATTIRRYIPVMPSSGHCPGFPWTLPAQGWTL